MIFVYHKENGSQSNSETTNVKLIKTLFVTNINKVIKQQIVNKWTYNGIPVYKI
jgi:hypothetical protein